jgi:peptidoglycan/xylan/chitin deacetylase (PgdA/CDA1 family)
MPKILAVGGIALIAATAVGCGMTTASPNVEGPIPSEPTMIDYVDPAHVSGLSVQTLSEGDPNARHVHVVYPSLADAPRFNEMLRRTVTEELNRFTESSVSARDPKNPGDNGATGALPAPEFNVDWQLAAVSSEAVGVRLRIGESTGAGWSESRTTLWYDRTDKRALDSTGLLKNQAALNTLAGLVKTGLAQQGPETNPSSVRPDPKMFDSLGFNPHGELVVEFDDRQVAPEALGRVAVALPRAKVEGLLSATGIRAQRAAAGPAVVPTPTPPSKESLNEASMAKPQAESSMTGSVNCAKTKCVALTYDDGPGPETGRLLDILADHNARATFFCLGSNASAHPELLQRMRNEGHLVANHTWSHRDLTAMSSTKITDQLVRTQREITQSIGQVPTLMRPPYGATDTQVASIAGTLGLAVVRWNVDTQDERDSDPRVIADRTVSQAKPGAIILMHDVHDATVDATPEILRRLTAKGYTFVTVPELYGSRGAQPGRTYDSGSTSPALDKQAMP